MDKLGGGNSQFFGAFSFDENITINIYGKKEVTIRKLLYQSSSFLSCGSVYLLGYWLPRFRSWAIMENCSFSEATHVLVESCFENIEICQVKKQKISISPAELFETELGLDSLPLLLEKEVLYFDYQYNRFFLNPFTGKFISTSQFACPILGSCEKSYERRKILYGENLMDIKEKPIFDLITENLAHPFNVFQIFSVIVWFSEEYEFYALCILGMTIFSLVMTVKETRANINRIRTMTRISQPVSILRSEKWVSCSSEDILPGDIFALDHNLTEMPCDAVLIEGEAIVDESMLTGETTPVSKLKIDKSFHHLKSLSHIFSNPKHNLFAGTRVLRVKSSSKIITMAMAYRTGFLTHKGSLIQSILFPRPDTFEYHKDSMRFIAFVVFAISVVNLTFMGAELYYIATRALDLITVILPPALPATLSIGIAAAIKRLKKEKITCIDPPKINVASKIERVCFDKTGTLTEDGLEIHEIFSNSLQQITFNCQETHKEALINHNEHLFNLFATCHSLKQFAGRLVGDPLETEMFEYTDLILQDSLADDHYRRIKLSKRKYTDLSEFILLREFEFHPELRRMTVIIRPVDGKNMKFAYTKGSPEFIRTACDPKTIPSNYELILKNYAKNGYRVIACAYKTIETTDESINNHTRQYFESDLSFLGFIAFENKVKPETIPVLKQLVNANLKIAMVTGDNILTAISVSRDCGIIKSDDKVYHPRSFEPNCMILSPIDSDEGLTELELGTVQILDSPIACSGDYLDSILSTLNDDLLRCFLSNCNIFGRMSPNQKRKLVEAYQKLGESICFCGDGANDCAALMAADVGVSLSQAESSVAAPFTSNICNISCIPKLIMNGRSSLVTAFVSFKFMSLYSIVQFTSLCLLYTFGSSLTDWQFIYMDLILILPLGILINQYGPSTELTAHRPTTKLISRPVLWSISVQMILQGIFQCLMFYLTRLSFPATPFSEGPNVMNIEATSLSLFSIFIYVAQAMIFSEGRPHRQSFYYPFIVYVLLALLCNTLMVFSTNEWLLSIMEFVDMPQKHRMVIFSMACCYITCGIFFDFLVGKFLRK